MPPRSIHIVVNSSISFFLWLNNIPLYMVCVCMYIYIFSHFLHLFIHWWTLRLFSYLGIVNNATMNMRIQIFLQYPVLVSFRYIPSSKIAGSHSSSIFNFWGTSILFSIVAAPVYNPTNSVGGFPFVHILTSICYLLFFNDMIVVLMDLTWHLIVVLICISLMISDVEHLFMYLLAICISSLEKCLFRSFAHFKLDYLFFCYRVAVF